jgi:hypothetical protein
MGDLTGLWAPRGTDATAHSSVAISSDSSARAVIRLKDYEIKGVIGEGGIGVVYRARHLVSDKPVAIKVLDEYCGRQKDSVEKLFVEAKAVGRIHQPNITDVTDFGTSPDGSVFVATGYLDGESESANISTRFPRKLRHLPRASVVNRQQRDQRAGECEQERDAARRVYFTSIEELQFSTVTTLKNRLKTKRGIPSVNRTEDTELQ